MANYIAFNGAIGEFSIGDITFTDNSKSLFSIEDSQGKQALAILPDGSLSIGNLSDNAKRLIYQLDNVKVVDSTALYSVEVDALGSPQIFKTLRSNGFKSQLTTTGSNWSIALTDESPKRILFSSDRSGKVENWIMDLDGTRKFKAAPTDLTFYGDSITEQLSATFKDPTRFVKFQGHSAQKTSEIIGRLGGTPVTGNITGGTIPGNGTEVAITSVLPKILYKGTSLTCITKGTVNGVSCILQTTDRADNHTIRREVSGADVVVTNPVTFVITSEVFSGTVFPEYVQSLDSIRNNSIVFIWAGRNDTNGDKPTLLALIDAGVQKISSFTKRFLVVSLINSPSEADVASGGVTADTAAAATRAKFIKDMNDSLRAAYPNNFVDVLAQMVAQTNASITFTPSTDPTSTYLVLRGSVAADEASGALLADGTHPNGTGRTVITNFFLQQLLNRGW